jgi:hypothetical protein
MKKYRVTIKQFWAAQIDVVAENEQDAMDKADEMDMSQVKPKYLEDCDASDWEVEEIYNDEDSDEELESEWKTEEHKKFARDMKKAGLEVYKYHGRNFYVGPAVNVSSIQNALSQTKVECRWDNMGYDHVVHPKY